MWWLFQGHTACEGESQGSNPDSRPCLCNHCSALPPRGWHAEALAPTRCWGHAEGAGWFRRAFWRTGAGAGGFYQTTGRRVWRLIDPEIFSTVSLAGGCPALPRELLPPEVAQPPFGQLWLWESPCISQELFESKWQKFNSNGSPKKRIYWPKKLGRAGVEVTSRTLETQTTLSGFLFSPSAILGSASPCDWGEGSQQLSACIITS